MSRHTKELELVDFEAGMLTEEAIEAKKRYDAFPKLLAMCNRAVSRIKTLDSIVAKYEKWNTLGCEDIEQAIAKATNRQ